jgi:hypothetical protein
MLGTMPQVTAGRGSVSNSAGDFGLCTKIACYRARPWACLGGGLRVVDDGKREVWLFGCAGGGNEPSLRGVCGCVVDYFVNRIGIVNLKTGGPPTSNRKVGRLQIRICGRVQL